MSFEVRRRQDPERDQAGVLALLAGALVMALSGVGFVVALALGSRVTAAGIALAVGMAAAAFVVRRASAASYPELEVAEPRHLAGPVEAPEGIVGPTHRRHLLTGTVVLSATVLGGSMLAPVTSLGPRPGRLDIGTGWAPGVRVVDDDGRPLRSDDVPGGGLSTCWPEDAVRNDTSSIVLVRLSDGPFEPTNLDWVVDDGLVAYSKLCTHMGCPVGLLQEGEGSLFCPCHQARFDARRGAVPEFGPPARALPQLPLGVNGDGYLVALDDFPGTVGPTTGRTTRRDA
ncbi:hypothetical protein BH23ACT9_BH23ACT9_30940 [soil metagenome]